MKGLTTPKRQSVGLGCRTCEQEFKCAEVVTLSCSTVSGLNEHSGVLELEKRIPIVITVDDNVTDGASSLGIAP